MSLRRRNSRSHRLPPRNALGQFESEDGRSHRRNYRSLSRRHNSRTHRRGPPKGHANNPSGINQYTKTKRGSKTAKRSTSKRAGSKTAKKSTSKRSTSKRSTKPKSKTSRR